MFYFCCFTTTITTIITTTTTTVSLLLLIPLCKQVFISGAVELTTQLSKPVRILCVPKCRINKLGYLAREDYLDPLQLRVITTVATSLYIFFLSFVPFIASYGKGSKSCDMLSRKQILSS